MSIMKKYKILYVEDLEIFKLCYSELFMKILNKDSVDLLTCSTGEEAKLRLKKEKIDFVILDWILPGEIDGLKLLRWIKKVKRYGPNTPVIFFSAVSEPDRIQKALKAGFNDYMFKPFSKELVRKVLKLHVPYEYFLPDSNFPIDKRW